MKPEHKQSWEHKQYTHRVWHKSPHLVAMTCYIPGQISDVTLNTNSTLFSLWVSSVYTNATTDQILLN